ncbi:MAG: DNA-binding protein [Anaerostipes sp.]|nr:DNA-binding protein [Anaerostipes sp.]
MERIVEQTLLYDFYGELLTEHQKQIFGDHVLNDMTATEIAKEHGITRQAAYDMIKRCNHILTNYEDSLHLVRKFLITKEKVQEIYELSRRTMEVKSYEVIHENMKKIEKVSSTILEEL